MNKKIIECLTNPIACKLYIEVLTKGKATAKELAKAHSDIPHATLYRHLKKMNGEGVLMVVEEHQIRGMIEKVYAVGDEFTIDTQKMIRENDGQAYMLMFNQFMMGLTKEFQEYTASSNINLSQDGSGFTVAPVYATTEELTAALIKIGEIINSLLTNEKTPERSLHNIAIITTPPKKLT